MNPRADRGAAVIGVAALLLAWSAGAGSGAAVVDRHVIAGGGGEAASVDRQLRGTIGQPVAGASASGRYQLRSGYWLPLARDDFKFADGFED